MCISFFHFYICSRLSFQFPRSVDIAICAAGPCAQVMNARHDRPPTAIHDDYTFEDLEAVGRVGGLPLVYLSERRGPFHGELERLRVGNTDPSVMASVDLLFNELVPGWRTLPQPREHDLSRHNLLVQERKAAMQTKLDKLAAAAARWVTMLSAAQANPLGYARAGPDVINLAGMVAQVRPWKFGHPT